MVIDLENLGENRMPGFKGSKGDTFLNKYENDLGKIMLGRLEPGSSIGLHTHEKNSEIIFIVSGKADFLYDDTTEKAAAGQCHYCPMGHSHSMINSGDEDLVFFAVVPEHFLN